MSSPSHLLPGAACIGFLAASLFVGGERVYSQTSPPETETAPQIEAEAGSLQRSSANSLTNSPTFELDIGVQQDVGDGGGDGASPGEDGRGSGDGPGGQGGAAVGDRQGDGGDGAGTTSSPGNQVGTGDGPGTGNGSGDGPGNGPGGGNTPVRTRRDYIPNVTGLIVDARQLDFLPSMSMRLFDPDGNQVYTTTETNRQLNTSRVTANGTAAFVTSESAARQLVNRIGERPHTIVAQRTQGYDLVISNRDAWELRNRNHRDRFLENYAVVVIWTPQ